jgi:hypothetical protein
MLPWTQPVRALAVFCAAMMTPGDPLLYAQPAQPQDQTTAPDASQDASLSPADLDSLVAPLALYPDSLVAQVLAAATYPLEIVEADRWVKTNSGLKGQALLKAAEKQNWEPAVQALVVFPQVLQQLDTNLPWTTALGNAFLAQEADVMSAIQRMRQKAVASGKLQSNAQQKVETQQADGAPVIVIQPANPDVIYVPSYDPTVVYGPAPVYAPYPAYSYPTGGYLGASFISFGLGVAVGSIFNGWNGGWGWGCNWGRHSSVFVNNTFINRYGFHGGGVYAGRYGNAAWRHNPAYRGAVPYSSAGVARRFGSTPGVRGPGGTPGAITRPGGAAGFRPPGGAPGTVPHPGAAGGAAGLVRPGTGAGLQPPGGARGAVNHPGVAQGGTRGNAGAIQTPNPRGSASRMQMPGAMPATPRGTFTNPKPSPFSGSGGQTRMNSNRGFSSMGGSHGGGGGFRGGGGGFRGGGGGMRGGGGGMRGGGGGRRR